MAELFREEQPHLQPLPASGFAFFRQSVRTVDDAGLVQVEGLYYAALPAAPHGEVTVRAFAQSIEILDARGQLLRRHPKATRKGAFVLEGTDRIFNPSRETTRMLARMDKIGPRTAASRASSSPASAARASARSTASCNCRADTPVPTSRQSARSCSPPTASPTRR
ncbi:MAG: hypothetical protein HS109_19240 [Burkholderiales bacterium]|nr:hypothetical protein [Burkholderiales bacterium]